VPGIFAAGDIRAGAAYRLVAAADEGTAAGVSAADYLDDRNAAR
jgi:thioredoxin reductase